MNKTININLGGLFFHIDENAYMSLDKYLQAISESLSDDPKEKKEILMDIESRISELLSEKIKDHRQVVKKEDIQRIIDIMGQPENYAETNENFESYDNLKNNATKKLYRNTGDRLLGGVASGLAHYLNLDTLLVRLAFLTLLFLGGISACIYLLLWILIPTAEKLQMKKESININNIEKNIRTQYDKVSSKIKKSNYVNRKNGFLPSFNFTNTTNLTSQKN